MALYSRARTTSRLMDACNDRPLNSIVIVSGRWIYQYNNNGVLMVWNKVRTQQTTIEPASAVVHQRLHPPNASVFIIHTTKHSLC